MREIKVVDWRPLNRTPTDLEVATDYVEVCVYHQRSNAYTIYHDPISNYLLRNTIHIGQAAPAVWEYYPLR